MEKHRGRSRFITLCVAPAAILFFIFMILPTLNVFRMSLFERGAYSPTETFVGLKNFQMLFRDSQFIRSMQNTILLIVVVTVITFALALVFAGILTREKIRGQNFFRVVFYIPNILSVEAYTTARTKRLLSRKPLPRMPFRKLSPSRSIRKMGTTM